MIVSSLKLKIISKLCRIVSDMPLPGPISSVLMIKDGKTIIVGASDGECVLY